MPLDNFPYSNFHALNLDWILKVVKRFEEEYTGIKDALDHAIAAIEGAEGSSIAAIGSAEAASLSSIQAQTAADLQSIATQTQTDLAALTTAKNTIVAAIEAQYRNSIANIPPDYTALLAALAQTYDPASTYLHGDFRWYNGSLYYALVDITTPEAWTAAHWTEAPMGDAVAYVTRGLDDVKEVVLPNNLVKTLHTGGGINYNNGTQYASENSMYSDYIPVSGSAIVYSRIATPGSSAGYGIAQYNANQEYITGQRAVVNADSLGFVLQEIPLNSATAFVRLTWSVLLNQSDCAVYIAEQYHNNLQNASAEHTAELADHETRLSDVETVVQEDILRQTPIDYSTADDILGFITTANKWNTTTSQANRSYVIPVPLWAQKCTVTAPSAQLTLVSVVTALPEQDGDTMQYAEGSGRIAVTAGNTVTVNIPDFPNPEGGPYYLIVLKYYSGADRTPASSYFSATNINDVYRIAEAVEPYIPDYTNKKFSVLGDSISTFVYTADKVDGKAPAGCTTNYPGNPVQYQNSDVTSPDLTWWGHVKEFFGMVLGVNESWAGSTIGYNSNYTDNGKYTADNCMCSEARIGHLDDNGTPDLILIFGGTNDINHHKSGSATRFSVGQLDNTHNPYDFDNFPMVTDTYYGAITTMILRIQHAYPNATILMILPYFCTYTHTSQGDRSTPYDQNEWSKAAIAVCDYLGVEYLDLRKIINLYDVSALLFDGLHPNSTGMEAIAKAVIHKLEMMFTN